MMSTANYSNVLVLCAPFNGVPTASCMHYLLNLQAMGATVQFSTCYAEAALTRCLQAASAYQTLQQRPQLQWVFWVDGDMCSYPSALESLMLLAIKLGEVQGEPILNAPTISGAYVNRHKLQGAPKLAAYAVRGALRTPVEVSGEEWGVTQAFVGMGCLLQSRAVFMAHCDESAHFCYPSEDYLVPLVCQSHRIHCAELAEFLPIDDSKDTFFWHSEDFSYCAHEFERGRLVYLADVPFGHEFLRVSYPDNGCVFPGFKPPEL
jgi:hypothetical protein